ncbi:hypothetical protein ACQY0O_001967 [Thecaphora frezii]
MNNNSSLPTSDAQPRLHIQAKSERSQTSTDAILMPFAILASHLHPTTIPSLPPPPDPPPALPQDVPDAPTHTPSTAMEAASIARKAKLEALRKRKADEAAGLVSQNAAAGDNDVGLTVKRHFRNYDPQTGQVRRFGGPKELQDTVENAVEGLQEDVIALDEIKRAEELDLTNIAPKRANWDLKRDMERRLQKLQRRDKEAILILIRQRIQAQQKAATGSSTSTVQADLTAATAEIAATATADLDANQDSDSDEE